MGDPTQIGASNASHLMYLDRAHACIAVYHDVSLPFLQVASRRMGTLKECFVNFMTGNLSAMSSDACEVHESFSFWVMAGDAKVLPHGLASFRTAVANVTGMWVAIACIHVTVSESRGAVDKTLLEEAEKSREVDRKRKAANEARGQKRKLDRVSREVSPRLAFDVGLSAHCWQMETMLEVQKVHDSRLDANERNITESQGHINTIFKMLADRSRSPQDSGGFKLHTPISRVRDDSSPVAYTGDRDKRVPSPALTQVYDPEYASTCDDHSINGSLALDEQVIPRCHMQQN